MLEAFFNGGEHGPLTSPPLLLSYALLSKQMSKLDIKYKDGKLQVKLAASWTRCNVPFEVAARGAAKVCTLIKCVNLAGHAYCTSTYRETWTASRLTNACPRAHTLGHSSSIGHCGALCIAPL